jgi:hypothetical protein
MEKSEIQKRIINLGKRLVKALKLDPGVDTLSRWMVHYIAEQMIIAENSRDNDKTKAEKKCFETILQLWDNRSSLPNGKRPFESFEPIFRALEKLDPENKHPYYFRYSDQNPSEFDKMRKIPDPVQEWLDIAEGIDQIIRIWLNYVFKQAALCATDENTIEWLKNSIEFKDNDDSLIITNFLSDTDEESKQQEKIKLLNEKIQKLEVFSNFNDKLLLILKEELKDISKD